MTKVFIGGSRRVSRLGTDVRRRIDRIIEKRFPVVIGDANGADRAVQDYLKDREYNQVEVFCVEGFCRNNVGNWPARSVPAPSSKKDFSYYEAKDKVMADEASVGLMIWDGKSAGTLMNVLRLVSQHKKVVVYIAPVKEFLNLNDDTDWETFLTRFGDNLRGQIRRRVATDEGRSPVSTQGSLWGSNKLQG